jgi:hypothetical protein
MTAETFSPEIRLGLGIYCLLLLITVIHIAGSRRERLDKTVEVLCVIFFPVGGMVDWWRRVIWGSREDQLARRNRTADQRMADNTKVGK